MAKRKKQQNDKRKIARIASLKGFEGVLLGRDIGGVLKEGHVYQIIDLQGVIMLKDLGEHGICEHFEGNRISYYATEGTHCLTKREREIELATKADAEYFDD